MKRINYSSGDKVGTLMFVKDTESAITSGRRTRMALFQCPCGKKFETIIRSAVTGNTKSCGCFYGVTPREDRTATHHLRQHPLYRIWCSIKTRCYNKRRLDYKHYGGRGIRMSSEFKENFKLFFDHVSSLPNYENRERMKLTLDRVKNSSHYERGNLRWATRKEQANNTRKNAKT